MLQLQHSGSRPETQIQTISRIIGLAQHYELGKVLASLPADKTFKVMVISQKTKLRHDSILSGSEIHKIVKNYGKGENISFENTLDAYIITGPGIEIIYRGAILLDKDNPRNTVPRAVEGIVAR